MAGPTPPARMPSEGAAVRNSQLNPDQPFETISPTIITSIATMIVAAKAQSPTNARPCQTPADRPGRENFTTAPRESASGGAR